MKKPVLFGFLGIMLLFYFGACNIDNDINGGKENGDEKFLVTFDLEGGTINNNSNQIQISVKSGKTIGGGITNPIKTGYTFGGWFTGKNGTGTLFCIISTTISSNLNVYAKWVTENNGNDSLIKVYNQTGSNTDFSIFGNTNTSSDGTLIWKGVLQAGEIKIFNIPNKYDIVNYRYNTIPHTGGTVVSGSVIVHKGEMIAIYLSDPSFPPPVQQNDYLLRFDLDGGYLVTWNSNGDIYHSTDHLQIWMKSGSTLHAELMWPSRDSHAFGGWFTGKNGTGTKYCFFTTIITSNLIVYANWIPTNNVQLSGITWESTDNDFFAGSCFVLHLMPPWVSQVF